MAEQSKTPWRLNAPFEAVQACLGTVYVSFEDNRLMMTKSAIEPAARKPRGRAATPAG